MSYQSFKNKWLGKSVDFDRAYGKQCVDLIKQYIYEETNIKPGSWGNAINYWNAPNPQFLALYARVGSAQAGDIIVLKPVDSAPSHANGHIGIYDSGSVAILEQNGSTGSGNGIGGNAIRVRTVPASRVVAIYRRKSTPAPVPTPSPAPTHPFYGLVGRTLKITESFRVYAQGTDIVRGKINNYNYIVRGVSSRTNRVVVSSASSGGLVDLPLADRNGKIYSGWRAL